MVGGLGCTFRGVVASFDWVGISVFLRVWGNLGVFEGVGFLGFSGGVFGVFRFLR